MDKYKKDYSMEIYTHDKQLIEERKNKYIQEGLALYENAKKLTNEKYKLLKKEFENGDKDAIRQLLEESTMNVIVSAASTYAKFDIEKYVSFKEGLSLTFEYLLNYHINYKFLPSTRVLYLSNIIQVNVYKLINKAYQSNKLRSREESMSNQNIAWLIDKQNADIISMENLNMEDLKPKIDKIMSNLSLKEQRVLNLILGFETGEKLTFEEAGEILNLSRSFVCDIYHRALKKLKNPKVLTGIREYSNTNLTI